MGKPLCSLLEVECVLPLLRKLLQSSWSSRCLSTDRLSFSIQLSVEHTEVRPSCHRVSLGRGQANLAVMWMQMSQPSVMLLWNSCGFLELEQTGIRAFISTGHETKH